MTANETISSGLLELYVLGLTNEQENTQVHSMLNDPAVREEMNAIELCMEIYANAHAIPVPQFTGLKNVSVNQTSNNSGAVIRSISPFWKYAAAASIILFMASAFSGLFYYNKYQEANLEKESVLKEKAKLESDIAAQRELADEMRNDMNVVQSKYSEPVALRGLPAAPDAAAKIFWMKNTGEVFIDPSNLPEPPNGMQYQLWAIVDGKPVDGGLIISTKNKNNYRIQKMKSFGKVDAFAVTLETAGGNLTPKGEMYVMGEL